MNKCPITIVVAAFNEERHLEACLKSAAFSDQIIVVDGGSTDRTRAIAEKFGECIITENAPAESQRLKGLQLCRNDWFFLLDADERISQELQHDIVRTLQSNQPFDAYQVLRKNIYQGRAVALHHPDYQIRLFKKQMISHLPQKIHRTPEGIKHLGRLHSELTHYFFSSVHEYLEKINFYTSKEATYLRAQTHWNGLQTMKYLLIRPPARFVQYYFLKKGFKDGFFGLFYATASAFYEWTVAAKVLLEPQMRHTSNDPLCPDDSPVTADESHQ